MGLRCSLFGHDFDEPVTERDREERGAEVVITVRKVQSCRRCGTERVVSENTEVRHVGAEDRGGAKIPEPEQESANGPTDETDEDGAPFGTDEAGSPDETEPDQATAQGETEEPETDDISQYVVSAEEDTTSGKTAEAAGAEPAEDTENEPPEDAEDEPAEAADGPSGDHGDAEVEILDSDESGAEPGPRSEATASETGPDETGPESPEETDSGEPDEAEQDDAIIMDNLDGQEARESDIGRRELAGSGNMFDASPPEGAEGTSPVDPGEEDTKWAGPEETGRSIPDEGEVDDGKDESITRDEPWPEEEQDEVDPENEEPSFQFSSPTEPVDDHQAESKDPGSGIITPGSGDIQGPTDDAQPSSLECPECGYQSPIAGSSLRAGDICPECHGSYLTERY